MKTQEKFSYLVNNLNEFHLVELKKSELKLTEGGVVWAFIGPAAGYVLAGSVLGAFAVGAIVGYGGYKLYQYLSE